MHPKFAALVDRLHPSFIKLTECPPHTGRVRLPLDVPTCGVYLFSEGSDHLYVGRTDRLRYRHKEHWSGKANDAPFAFKLARHATNNILKGGPTRKALEADPLFAAAFISAKERVAKRGHCTKVRFAYARPERTANDTDRWLGDRQISGWLKAVFERCHNRSRLLKKLLRLGRGVGQGNILLVSCLSLQLLVKIGHLNAVILRARSSHCLLAEFFNSLGRL